MSLLAILAAAEEVITLIYKAVVAYQNYEERLAGRAQLRAEMAARDAENKEAANAIDLRERLATRKSILDRL